MPYTLHERDGVPWHLKVFVWNPEDLEGMPRDALDQLLKVDSGAWSAATICRPNTTAIIINSSHAITRQNNSIMHELSHLILDHKPTRVDVMDGGRLLLQSYRKDQEEQADWLAGTLLVPRVALLAMRGKGADADGLARHFGVSVSLLEWRRRMTAVDRQLRARIKPRR